MVHVPGTLLLVHYLGFAGAGWAVVVMRTAHLSFTIGQSPQCFYSQCWFHLELCPDVPAAPAVQGLTRCCLPDIAHEVVHWPGLGTNWLGRRNEACKMHSCNDQMHCASLSCNTLSTHNEV